MNHTEVAQGDYIRITAAHSRTVCIGCVLQRDDWIVDSHDWLVDAPLAIVIKPSEASSCFREAGCFCGPNMTFELLSPEEVMEVKLSR